MMKITKINVHIMFNGRNILPNFPEKLIKVVNFLNEKAAMGDFEFSDTPSHWEDNEDIIAPLGLKMEGQGLYFAVALAYITNLGDGKIVFSNKDNVWRWVWSLHVISGVAAWRPEFMKRVIQSLEGKMDNLDFLLNWALQVYGNAYYEGSVTLISLLPQYRVSLLSGLMENDFDRFCADFPPANDTDEFANAFLKANLQNEENYNKAFDIAMAFPSFSSSAAMAFFLSISGRLSKQRKVTCEQKIIVLLQGDVSPYVVPVCNWLSIQQKVTPLIETIVILLVKGLDVENKEVALKNIDDSIHFFFKDPVFLTKLFVTIAEQLQPTDILTMEGCLRSLYENKEYFQNFVLAFVMHPKGLYRIVGRRLWDDYHLESSDFDPKKDLEERFQCLFIISMLQDYGNPETRLPKLLPLIDSKSERVRNILMGQLGPYLDDYMGHVIKAFDNLKIKSKYVKIIKQYYKKRSDAIKKRRSIKELSPRYVYVTEFLETMRLQKEHLQGEMKEAEKGHKSAWKDMMKQVVLARGRSWRDENGKIQHLAHFKFSVPSRQLVQSMTPMEQEDWINEMLKDWNDTTGNN